MCMSLKEGNFWRNLEKYHSLAEDFERNIKIKHPNSVSSKGMCPCLEFCSYCGWSASKVKYYEYGGERV